MVSEKSDLNGEANWHMAIIISSLDIINTASCVDHFIFLLSARLAVH